MKAKRKQHSILLNTACLLLCVITLNAQTADARLDQPVLMKQMIGTWENRLSPDTSVIWELKAYGHGLEAHYRFTAKGKTYREVKQLTGFDGKFEKFTTFTLFPNGKYIMFFGSFYKKITCGWK